MMQETNNALKYQDHSETNGENVDLEEVEVPKIFLAEAHVAINYQKYGVTFVARLATRTDALLLTLKTRFQITILLGFTMYSSRTISLVGPV